jgi:carbon monoxide dehydrogenase subunit G
MKKFLGIAVAIVSIGIVAGCQSSASNNPPVAVVTTQVPVSSGVIPGSGGITVSSLESSVKAQLVEAQPGGFGVTGVASVVCNPPTDWVPAGTFTCFVYQSNGNGLGEVDSTVEPTGSDGTVNWNAEWNPTS